MSTPTTTRGALLRRAGTLLVAAVLVGAPATSALADPTATPTPTTSPTTSTTSPTPTTTTTTTASPEPTTTVSPTIPAETTSPSPTDPLPSPTSTPSAGTPTPSGSSTTGPLPGEPLTAFGPDAATGPATSADPTLVAARYLEQQLAATGFMLQSYGYPDQGLTADAILALDAAGTGQDAAAKATKNLVMDPVAYTGFGNKDEVYAGAVAKLLNVAIAQGIDPTALGADGTFDVLAELKGLEAPNGRFSDISTWGDYSNTFGQSFGLIGLHRAGEPVSSDAKAYLLAQQCPAGGFKLYMDDAGCTTDADADPDATAMAVQALVAVGGASAQVGDALDYLAAAQGASGGVSSPAQGVNANTTGLAGQAFLAGGRTAQARAAVSYLTALQYGCGFPASIRGGIAYDQKSYKAQKDLGSKAEPVDIDRRSTSQALLALAGTPLAAVTASGSDAVAPALACASTTSPTTTPTTTVEPTSNGGPAAGDGGSDPSETVAAAPSGSLAQTGTDLLLPALLGLLLVVLGAVAVFASTRRRGAHA